MALNNRNFGIEVHQNEGRTALYCRVGWFINDDQDWSGGRMYAEGRNRALPAVALNDADFVVEGHEVREGRKVWVEYGVGKNEQSHVRWSGPRVRGAEGAAPAIAINNHKTVVAVHVHPYGRDDRTVSYTVGRVTGTARDPVLELEPHRAIRLPVPGRPELVVDGLDPSVALTDDGLVIVVMQARTERKVFELVGEVSANGTSVTWKRWWYYDDGTDPSVAAAGTLAVEFHQHTIPGYRELRFSTSLITDRVRWMQDRLALLGPKRLRDLVFPASHDSGMYLGDVTGLGTTQNLSIYEQLRYGIRYFDLRWEWVGNRWMIHHGSVRGPELQTVLDQIKTFAMEGHRELIILVFSSFKNGDHNDLYRIMSEQVVATIWQWLVKSKPPGDKRLADVTLNEYLKDIKEGPAILLAVHKRFAVDNPRSGFWVYRDWHEDKPGDLCVHDWYAKTEVLVEDMKKDQLDKFHAFKGHMRYKPDEPCDLFLLSWTLTPIDPPRFPPLPPIPPTPRQLSRRSNPSLGQEVRLGHPPFSIPNAHGKIINMVYVDFVESARVTDVALFLNGERTTTAAETKPRRRAKTTTRPKAKAKTRPKVKATTRPRAKATTRPRAKATTRRRAK